MTEREALKLALEALKQIDEAMPFPVAKLAIMEAEKALAQPEQEPVALPCCGYTDASAIKWNPYNQVVQCHNCGQVYTTPPQRTWVGLTGKEVAAIFTSVHTWHERAEAIEAKLKEKNHG